jgi:lipoprotein-releasing system permease protein
MFRRNFELFVALKYLTAKGKETFLSVITLISVGGVAVGVAALIIVISVMNGFETDMREKILGTTAHIQVYHVDHQGITDYEAMAEKIRGVAGVVGVAPFVFTEGILSSKDDSIGVAVRGVDPVLNREVSDIEGRLVAGSMELTIPEKEGVPPMTLHGPAPKDGIVLGSDLAKNLNVKLNDTVTLISPQLIWNPIAPVPPKMKNFRVVGIFDIGMYEYDSTLCIVGIKQAQEFLELEGKVNGLEVKVDDVFAAPEIADKINDVVGFPYYASDWTVTHEHLFTILALEKTVMFVILALIVIVAAFNILSTLIMVVMEKTREIGILKAMGSTRAAVVRIFVAMGLVIGLVGTSVGVVLGLVLSYLLDRYQFVNVPAELYGLETMPVVIQAGDVIVICVVGIGICVLATVYPAFRAARLDPVQAIQYE